jgi:hypothetical protein
MFGLLAREQPRSLEPSVGGLAFRSMREVSEPMIRFLGARAKVPVADARGIGQHAKALRFDAKAGNSDAMLSQF